MEPVYLICYGDSEENIQISLEKKIIGASNYKKIPAGQLIYLIVKRAGEWIVVGKGHIAEPSSVNPFAQPNRFATYISSDLRACKPFSISELCKRELGNRYGLVMRTPQPISASAFIKYLDEQFEEV